MYPTHRTRGGSETTEGPIGLGLSTLFHNPDQMEQLRGDPTLTKGAVEELLRYDTSVQRQALVVNENMGMGGRLLKKGQYVHLFVVVASRDPDNFPDPDRLDIERRLNRHLTFGHGIHTCIGGPLARIELQVALSTLLRRFPNIRLPEQNLAFEELLVLRKLKSLVVTI